MCILLFNNKIKLDKLTDVMSTKVNKNVKLDTKISIPEGYVGLIYYKDHYLYTIESGEYKLNNKNFEKLIIKNERRNKKSKRKNYNFNLHFINTKELNISFEFKVITSFKQKSKYLLTSTYAITNPKAFASELLTTWYKTTNNRTNSYITSWFKELADIILRKFDKTSISNNDFLKEYANKFFKKYGVTVNSISLSTDNSSFFTPRTTTKEELKDNIDTPIIQPNDNTVYFNNDIIKQRYNYCHKCQAKIIDGSVFCLKCGERITNNANTDK